MPDLSVSIVNTNSRELLLACLESLAGTAAEVVVLDNASEDGSAEAVRERFPDVRLIAQSHRASSLKSVVGCKCPARTRSAICSAGIWRM